ncbi:hypothetical protein BaRGS_00001303, partial [Batillaria attramentaria]
WQDTTQGEPELYSFEDFVSAESEIDNYAFTFPSSNYRVPSPASTCTSDSDRRLYFRGLHLIETPERGVDRGHSLWTGEGQLWDYYVRRACRWWLVKTIEHRILEMWLSQPILIDCWNRNEGQREIRTRFEDVPDRSRKATSWRPNGLLPEGIPRLLCLVSDSRSAVSLRISASARKNQLHARVCCYQTRAQIPEFVNIPSPKQSASLKLRRWDPVMLLSLLGNLGI